MTDIIRVLRILEYVGPREQIERTLAQGAVPANGQHHYGDGVIRSAIIGQYPEVLSTSEQIPYELGEPI